MRTFSIVRRLCTVYSRLKGKTIGCILFFQTELFSHCFWLCDLYTLGNSKAHKFYYVTLQYIDCFLPEGIKTVSTMQLVVTLLKEAAKFSVKLWGTNVLYVLGMQEITFCSSAHCNTETRNAGLRVRHFYSQSQNKSSKKLLQGSLPQLGYLKYISMLVLISCCLHTHTPPRAATEGSVPWWRGLLGIVPRPAVAVTLNTAESSSHQAS